MLVAVTLNGTIYAWNADTGNLLWNDCNLTTGCTNASLPVQDCGAGGAVSTPTTGGTGYFPFAGIIATPVIDISGSSPVMFATSLCLASGATIPKWWLDEIDLTTGLERAHALIGASLAGSDSADDLASGVIPFKPSEVMQRPALLEVPNPSPGGSNPSNLIYVSFGTAVDENKSQYHGWVFGFNCTSTALTQEFAFNTSSKGWNGNTDTPVCTPCTAPCDPTVSGSCPANCILSGYPTSANWCGHGGGIWMSGRGPAAATLSNGSHAYLAVGNGPFQQNTSGGGLLPQIQNWGQSTLDFRFNGSTIDSSPGEYFTPYGGKYVEAPLGPVISGVENLAYTFAGLNQNDFDMSTSGVLLFDDASSNHWLLTIDKAGYGYMLRQGSLCDSTGGATCYPEYGSTPGFTSGDPGNAFAFAANLVQCPDGTDPKLCDRITTMAFDKDASPKRLYVWPNGERLTALSLSNNSATSGSGTLSTSGSSGPYTSVTLSSGGQVIPGDAIAAGGQTVRVITVDATGTSLTVSPGFTSSLSGVSFNYAGYFVNPIYDAHPAGGSVEYPGGSHGGHVEWR